MDSRKLIELDADNLCFHEFEVFSETKSPTLTSGHRDVTDRIDGPFLGKVYDPKTDTFAEPPTASPVEPKKDAG